MILQPEPARGLKLGLVLPGNIKILIMAGRVSVGAGLPWGPADLTVAKITRETSDEGKLHFYLMTSITGPATRALVLPWKACDHGAPDGAHIHQTPPFSALTPSTSSILEVFLSPVTRYQPPKSTTAPDTPSAPTHFPHSTHRPWSLHTAHAPGTSTSPPLPCPRTRAPGTHAMRKMATQLRSRGSTAAMGIAGGRTCGPRRASPAAIRPAGTPGSRRDGARRRGGEPPRGASNLMMRKMVLRLCIC